MKYPSFYFQFAPTLFLFLFYNDTLFHIPIFYVCSFLYQSSWSPFCYLHDAKGLFHSSHIHSFSSYSSTWSLLPSYSSITPSSFLTLLSFYRSSIHPFLFLRECTHHFLYLSPTTIYPPHSTSTTPLLLSYTSQSYTSPACIHYSSNITCNLMLIFDSVYLQSLSPKSHGYSSI